MLYALFAMLPTLPMVDDERISPITAAEEQADEDDLSLAALRIILVNGRVEDKLSIVTCVSPIKSVVAIMRSLTSSLPLERIKFV